MWTFDHIPAEDESVDDEYLLIGDDGKATNIAIQDGSSYGGGFAVNEYDDGHATLSVRTIGEATTLNHAKRIAVEAWIKQGTHKYAHLIGKRVHFVDGLDNYPTVMVSADEYGTVTRYDGDSLWVKLENHRPELDEWENEVQAWDHEDPDYPLLAQIEVVEAQA
jgi:hypothetical protein